MAPASCLFSYIKIEDVLLKGLVPVICICFHNYLEWFLLDGRKYHDTFCCYSCSYT